MDFVPPSSDINVTPSSDVDVVTPSSDIKDFVAIAQLIAGADAPPWLSEHLRRWIGSLFVNRGVEQRQPTRAEMRKILAGIETAATTLSNALASPPVLEFLGTQPLGPIRKREDLSRDLADLASRAKRAADFQDSCDSGRRHESWARKGSSARHDFVPCVLRPHCCRDVEAFSRLLPLAQSKSRGSCRSAMARGRRKHAALGRRAPQLLALSLPESPRARRREIAGGIPATPSRIRATMEIAVWCPRVGQLREEKNPPPFGSIVFHSNPQKYPPWWSRSASASTDAVGGRHDLDKSHPQSIRCQSRRSKAPG